MSDFLRNWQAIQALRFCYRLFCNTHPVRAFGFFNSMAAFADPDARRQGQPLSVLGAVSHGCSAHCDRVLFGSGRATQCPAGARSGAGRPIPAPRCDHRQHQDPALAQQVPIDTRIVFADLVRRMGEVELDRSTATRLKIYEHQPVPRAEHVPRVRFAVQHLLGAAALADRSPQASQRVAEQPPIRVGERRSTVAIGHELLSRLDTIREMRRRAPRSCAYRHAAARAHGRSRLVKTSRDVTGS